MEWPSTCPKCASRYEDIHGMVYALGFAVGVKCDHDWHRGPGYAPEKLNLTDDDLAWLGRLRIGV